MTDRNDAVISEKTRIKGVTKRVGDAVVLLKETTAITSR